MGCVLGRGTSSESVSESKQESKSRIDSNRKAKNNVALTKEVTAASSVVEVQNEDTSQTEEEQVGKRKVKGERRRSKRNPRPRNLSNHVRGEQVAAGWPSWLSDACGEALDGWIPRKADTFEKIDKIGQGTYSNVYKAKDMLTGKIVALKKVRFDNLEPESVKFMAREILILRRLDHPNVIKLEGLVTSRMSCSLYLVFQYMAHDLAGLAASPDVKFNEQQVKCYMQQILSGLEHCHGRGVLHRDIKGSNLLIDDCGVLKIGDFGLATFFDPNQKHQMTNRVVTLWYRAPELLLGAIEYGVGIDLWSAGCILAELLYGRPIMPGRTEVEQLHKIYKLCGSPSDDYWRKAKLPRGTMFKPREPYKRRIREQFKDFSPASLSLIDTLLSIDPAERQTATAALISEFFTTEPHACRPSDLPKYPPTKEMDAKKRDDEARKIRAANKAHGESARKTRPRAPRAMAAPDANAEIQSNIDRRRLITHANAKSKSEKFPPPHQDGALGFPLGSSHHVDPSEVPFSSTSFIGGSREPWSGPLAEHSDDAEMSRRRTQDAAGRRNPRRVESRVKGKKAIV